ncbi:3-[(3aS,4S,7aS)-7a-methyl-1,5-dioxo-octahydro-1H-inden-4-yl]propanoyl:CoA ligase-like [Haliotis rubra]|uniref:3-[(3aS,4S,7aS)-7a-methyl-1, 5-dioxo-octahydro-1H-inden-4-yl]propanoyl:CoA ligase-like n=1 Tax=Haliotis rubra TaxID=36100 RepID=UPI001EE5F5B2|nr:3-[(3aS,4S,7aS)-7a-methyl-1,5-dioxo-octahydro-1H-inden-4-yl]propanoyl:CoA ligase-like [Haliotis rubra]
MSSRGGGGWGWGVLELASRFALRLTQQGVQPGDVVCVCLPNSPERVVVDFGVQLTGAVSMNGRILRSDCQDILESMRKAKCKVLVIDPDETSQAWKMCRNHVKLVSEDPHMPTATSVAVPTLTNIAFCKTRKPDSAFLKTLPPRTDRAPNNPKQKPTDVAYIFATSGTTGYSKLVQHTNRSLMVMSFRLSEATGMKDKHCKSFSAAPLGWIGGFLAYYLFSGCPLALVDDTAEAVADRLQYIWGVACKEDITVCTLASFQFMGIFGRKDICESSCKKLPMIVTGGQPLHKEYLQTIGKLADSLFGLYASTEVGYAAGIAFSTSNLGCWYVDAPDKQAAILPEGWFRTDDVGYMDDKGCLFVEGRRSDAIMHGPYIVYLTWLEEKLAKCPGVKQNYFVPVPDRVLHHEICACVQLEEGVRLTEEDVINFIRGDIVDGVRSDMDVVPKNVLFFDTFPITKTFKLDRNELTRSAQLMLQLE